MLKPVCAVLCLLIGAPSAVAQSATTPYRTLRHDEDYAALADRAQRTDSLDPLKNIPLSDTRPGWYLTLGGEARERIEVFENTGWEKAAVDAFLLQKFMLFADAHLGRRVRVFAGLKSGLERGLRGGPRPTDEDQLDVDEAFVDVHAWDNGVVRVGRRELAFGAQRLVSIRNLNVRLAFDGISAIVTPGRWRLEAFGTKPVATTVGIFDDVPDHAQTLWGLYAAGPLFDQAGIDLYYLGLDRKRVRFDQGTAAELRESVGARLWRRGAAWDYDVEMVWQWGRFGTAPIRAWTIASDTGHTFKDAPWHPRLGMKADVTSGDDDPRDPALQSFSPLFPRGAYFGENPLVGPMNHIDVHPSLELHPVSSLSLTASWDFFWRQSLADGVYGVPGTLLRSAGASRARYVGSQARVLAVLAIDRHASVAADLEHFIAGPFLKESGTAHNVTFFGAWVSYVF